MRANCDRPLREPIPVGPRAHTRTRAEAAALAAGLSSQLAVEPARFDAIARAQSDASDAERGGDVGMRSTYDAGSASALLETCARLEIGAVSSVLETRAGFELVRRTDNLPRQPYRYTDLFVPYRGAMPLMGASKSKADAATIAHEVMREAQSKGFEAARALCLVDGCFVHDVSGTGGRGQSVLERAVLSARVGDVTGVLDSGLGYHIVRREVPVKKPLKAATAVSFELPTKPRLDQRGS